MLATLTAAHLLPHTYSRTLTPLYPYTYCRVPLHVLPPGVEVGVVTSGGYSPCLKKGVGMCYVPPHLMKAGTELSVEVALSIVYQ